MGVDHCMHVRPDFVDLAVNETLESQPAATLIEGAGVQVELHDVLRGHQGWRKRARHQVTVRIRRMPDAHMPGLVEHSLLGQDAIGRDEVFDENWSDLPRSVQ